MCARVCYNEFYKRINAKHLNMHIIFVVGHTAGRYLLGDKEIAVQIRGNSHYRNSACTSSSQVGMLIALCIIKVSWAIRGDGAAVRCRISDLILLWAG